MACIVGKVCPGVKNRTGALIAALSALCLGIILIVHAILSMTYAGLELLTKEDRRTAAKKEMVEGYYGAGFAIWGVWVMLTAILIFGIMVENKRALGFWMVFTLLIPVYFVCGLVFLLVTDNITGWEIGYLLAQGMCILSLIWIYLAIWVYFMEIRQRDKNPELRENEVMFAQPFMGAMPPAGSYNPGYGAPSGGSMSSIPRSQKSRHTYAPTEAGESVRGPSLPRQSRLDQYRAQHVEKSPIKDRSRSRSGEREGGTTYYRYQYTADQKKNGSYHGSQGSLGGRPVAQPPQYPPPQYQPARYQRPQPTQPTQAQLHGSQGSLGVRQPYQPPHDASQGSMGGRQPYQPQYHASQGSIGGRQPYQPQHHASQGSIGGRQPYQPQHHASQGSLGGRQPYSQQQLQVQDTQYSKDSEV